MDWTFLFLLSTQLRHGKNMLLNFLFVCLILAGCGYSWCIVRKVRTVRTFRGSGCRGGFGGKLHHIRMERANVFLNFSSFPHDSVPHPRFWNVCFGSMLHHLKEFLFSRCLQSSRILGLSSENSTRLFLASVVGLPAVVFRRSLQFVRRAAKDGCGSSMANEPFETSTPRSSWIGRSSSLPMRWCCAACVCVESGGCQ